MGGVEPAAGLATAGLGEPAIRAKSKERAGWLLAGPAVVVLLVMTIAPAIYLLYSSLFDYRLLGFGRRFVGLENYKDIIVDPNARHAFIITLIFVAIVVTLELVLGMLLAVPLARNNRGNKIAGTLLLLPFAVTPAVSALVWRQLLNPNFGWVDYYLTRFGLTDEPITWLSSPDTAWIALTAIDVWQWTPFVALILMAGLQGLPREPREAAAVDGATPWETFRYVTLPLLRPFIAVAGILRLVDAFKTFATVKVLTEGGPGRSTELISLDIYRVALESFDIGAAAAMGIFFLLLLSVIVPKVLAIFARETEILEGV